MKKSLYLPQLIAHLFKTSPSHDIQELHSDLAVTGKERKTTSVRLSPMLRKWVETESNHLEISQQDFISLTLKAVMQSSMSENTNNLDTMVSRFFELFESHQINMIDIPKFMPKSFKRSDIKNPNALIDVLNDDVIAGMASIFNINPGWLKSDGRVHETRRFYKSLSSILDSIVKEKLRDSRNRTEVYFVTQEGVDLDTLNQCRKQENQQEELNPDDRLNIYVCIVLKHTRHINEEAVATYELWDDFRWGYLQARLYVKAFMYFCEKSNICVSGKRLPNDIYEDTVSGHKLLAGSMCRASHFEVAELVWDDVRNTELDELEVVKEFFINRKCELYFDLYRRYYAIKNIEEYVNGHQHPEIETIL